MSVADPQFRTVERNGIRVIRCRLLDSVSGVEHGFSTRMADETPTLDFGPSDTTDPVRLGSIRRFLDASGLGGRDPAVVRQIHGAVVHEASDRLPTGDAVFALARSGRRTAPAVRTADCVPILMADSRGRAVAAIHAGWRGTVAGIVRVAVERLSAQGIEPRNLVAAIGPAIGPCCYEVGAEVSEALLAGVHEGGAAGSILPSPGRVDLRQANRLELERSGVDPGSIAVSGRCTCCDPAGEFHSHRGSDGAAGRMLSAIGWTPGGPDSGGSP